MRLNSSILYLLFAAALLLVGALYLSNTPNLQSDAAYDPESVALEKIWETSADFRVPEAVLFNPERDLLYVANINGPINAKDGNGFISTIDLNGEVLELHWATGLNGPKGMSMYDGILYVADITEIVAINPDSGEIIERYPAEDSVLLNDLTVTETGTIYASDTFAQRIYKLQNGQTSLFLENPLFDTINGITYDQNSNRLMSGSFNNGTLFSIDLEDLSITPHLEEFGSFDGIEADGYGNYWVSDFQGRLFLTNLLEQFLIDGNLGVNAADIEYIADLRTLYVPTFGGNQVIAYKVKTANN